MVLWIFVEDSDPKVQARVSTQSFSPGFQPEPCGENLGQTAGKL